MNKTIELKKVVDFIKDGDMVAFGGNVLHRSPIAVAKEIVRQEKRNLHIVKTAMAMEVDILCKGAAVSRVSAGFVGYETEFGLCNFYRKAVQEGSIVVDEHACYSIITGLRASAYGVPFLPIRGLQGSDLLKAVGFKSVIDPYSNEELIAIKVIRPDFGFIHVQKADKAGNGRIIGPTYEDLIIARGAKTVVLTCEELVDEDYFKENEIADISSVLVDHVVVVPKGASPGDCANYYEMDRKEVARFKEISTDEDFKCYLREVE